MIGPAVRGGRLESAAVLRGSWSGTVTGRCDGSAVQVVAPLGGGGRCAIA
jgi:hypothetical protein